MEMKKINEKTDFSKEKLGLLRKEFDRFLQQFQKLLQLFDDGFY